MGGCGIARSVVHRWVAKCGVCYVVFVIVRGGPERLSMGSFAQMVTGVAVRCPSHHSPFTSLPPLPLRATQTGRVAPAAFQHPCERCNIHTLYTRSRPALTCGERWSGTEPGVVPAEAARAAPAGSQPACLGSCPFKRYIRAPPASSSDSPVLVAKSLVHPRPRPPTPAFACSFAQSPATPPRILRKPDAVAAPSRTSAPAPLATGSRCSTHTQKNIGKQQVGRAHQSHPCPQPTHSQQGDPSPQPAHFDPLSGNRAIPPRRPRTAPPRAAIPPGATHRRAIGALALSRTPQSAPSCLPAPRPRA